jgi:hypothetical protein
MAEAGTDTENDLVFGFSRPAQLTSLGPFGLQILTGYIVDTLDR